MATPTVVLSADFKQRATAKLEAASAGKFFQSNNARLMPSFDRGSSAATGDKVEESNGEHKVEESGDELTLGVKLGAGAFCDVNEISSIVLKRKADNPVEDGDDDIDGRENFLPKPKMGSTHTDQTADETDESDFPVNLFETKDEIRKYMSQNFIRKDDIEGDNPRYAIKQLKTTNSQKQLEMGLLDISIEARFLACISHPNIIKMRGIAGEPLTPSFGVVLDRLYGTLEDRMDLWTEEKKNATGKGLCGCISGKTDPVIQATIAFAAITVAYDLACALRYIHGHNLVYRDIKPENAGFDVRGDIKLFDFGFCKELTRKLFDQKSGLYKLTRMTGSPPYMAPENFQGKPYGKTVDTFSFGVMMWEMIHCKFAFYHYSKLDYKQKVVEMNFRPSIDSSLSPRMQELIKESWDPDPKKRPPFDRIALALRTEYQELSSNNNKHRDEISRSERMMMASMRSFRMNRERGGK